MPAQVVIDQTTLVHVSAAKSTDPSWPYKLSIFPQRGRDTTVFFTRAGKLASEEKPREVVWMAHGLDLPQLPPGVEIKISRKNPGPPLLSNGDKYTLTKANPTQSSGSAVQLPPNQREGTWSYKVDLLDAASNRLADTIDPDVIVKEDP